MTTIIATRKALYADTLCPHTVPFKFSKIVRIGDSLFAGAGTLSHISKYLDWKRGGDKPEFPAEADFDILEINRHGIFLHDQDLAPPIKLKEKHYAIGSGAQYAMGALAMGASVEQALVVAARFDPDTQVPIEILSL